MKKMYISTKGMSREQWLMERKEGIGGSDAAAVMGESMWGSPLSVYADKLGLAPEKAMTEAMRQGVAFEGEVARRFSEETGMKVRRCLRMYRHPEHAFMLANIDRQVLGQGGFEGLECKTTSLFNSADFVGGEIPREYYWQCMHYMAVTGANRWHLGVMVLSKGFYRFVIERDERIVERLISREKDFWENNVLAGVPPRPSGLDADDEAVGCVSCPEAGKGGGPSGANAAADFSDLAGELDSLAKLKEEKSGLDRRIKASEQLVKMRMGDLTEALAGSWHIRFGLQDHASLDTARLKTDCPDLYARYLKNTPRRVLKIKDRALN